MVKRPCPRLQKGKQMTDEQRDIIVKQRGVIRALIRAWPGGKDSVSFAGVARQVREVMGDMSFEWRDLGGPPPKGRCGYEQFEPDSSSESITEQQALEGVNAIRNSIVGAQTFNWSEHMYPLVSLLNRAGYEGLPYPEAKVNVGTLLDRIAELEAAARVGCPDEGQRERAAEAIFALEMRRRRWEVSWRDDIPGHTEADRIRYRKLADAVLGAVASPDEENDE